MERAGSKKSRGERVAEGDVARAERACLLVPRHGEAEVRGQADARRRDVELVMREAILRPSMLVRVPKSSA